MNIRAYLLAIVALFCGASLYSMDGMAQEAEMMMMALKRMPEEQIRQIANEQCPVDYSGLMSSARAIAVEGGIAALLAQHYGNSTFAKVAFAALGLFELLNFSGALLNIGEQYVKREEFYNNLMNMRSGAQMHDELLSDLNATA